MTLLPFIITFQFTFVSVSHYYPTTAQCDAEPLITADMSRIDTVALRSGQLKWCALSRDMIWCEYRQTLTKDTTVWRGKYRFGDSIYVSGLGWYVVKDVMNKRFKQKVDILSFERTGYTKSAIIEVNYFSLF
jgi:hypothetical protein